MVLIFDVETAPNPELVELALEAAQARARAERKGNGNGSEPDPEAIKADMALSPVYGRIIGVGVLSVGEDREAGEPWVWIGEDERAFLELFWHHAEGCGLFISWNGLAFDVPWLYVRSLVRGVRPTVRISTARFRYPGESNHLDLFALLTDWRGNQTKRLKLDLATVARTLGVEPHVGDGAEVPKLWERGDYDAIREHLASDLRATLGVWRALGCPGLTWEPIEVPF